MTFHVDGPEWEVVTVNAVRSGVGAGRAMLEGLRRRAEAAGASKVWLITSDTNDGAIGFYEHLGMRRVRLHWRFSDVVRAAKPDVDEGAFCNAIEFEWRIGLGSASDHSAALTLESLRLVADPSARLPRPRTEEQELLRRASTRQVPRTRAALPAVVPPMR